MRQSLLSSEAVLLPLFALLQPSTSQPNDPDGNDVLGIGASGAGSSKSADTDLYDDDDDDDPRDDDHTKYYMLIIILVFFFLLAAVYIVITRRKRHQAIARRARALNDLEASRGQRVLVHDRQTGVLGTWGVQMTNWRSRDGRGRGGQAEGLNEQGEAPPPYTPKGLGEGTGDKIPAYEEVLERDREREADNNLQRPSLARTRLSSRGEHQDIGLGTASR